MNRTHPIKWVATYKDGSKLHQYSGRKPWEDKNKNHRFQEINLKKLAVLKVVDKKGNIICRSIKKYQNIEVKGKSYAIELYANGKKLSIGSSFPHYFHHFSGNLGDRMAFKAYGFELIQDHVNEYGIKLVSTKLRLLMPIAGNDLSGVIKGLKGIVQMSVEFRSFTNTDMRMHVKTFNENDISFNEHILIDGKIELDHKIDFNVIELNIGD